MDQPDAPDPPVEAWLKVLGIESLCQWDVLVFLYRHQASLIGADYLALLLGYTTEPVVAALDVLAALGLLERSRVSQGARLYQFSAPPAPPRGDAFERLLALAGHRAGRLVLSGHLRQDDRPPPQGLETARRFLEQAPLAVRAAPQRSPQHEEGRKTWRKAI